MQLAAKDTRQPVPLQPLMASLQKQNMLLHLVALQWRIYASLARTGKAWPKPRRSSTRPENAADVLAHGAWLDGVEREISDQVFVTYDALDRTEGSLVEPGGLG